MPTTDGRPRAAVRVPGHPPAYGAYAIMGS